jgi:HEAT repeat protein
MNRIAPALNRLALPVHQEVPMGDLYAAVLHELLQMLASPKRSKRLVAIRVLGQTGEQEALQTLRHALK